MMTIEQSKLITETGEGAPAGELLRRYWQPAALSDELAGPRPVRPVRLLGRDMVLFRDSTGQLGLLDRDCPHRGADLAFGRLEENGLRCLFHGWLFDRNGTLLANCRRSRRSSQLCTRVVQRSYPVVERNGIIFAYLGVRRAAGISRRSIVSSRRTATCSRSRGIWTATGCRRSKSGSTRRTRVSCIAFSKTPTRRRTMAGSSAPRRRTATCR